MNAGKMSIMSLVIMLASCTGALGQAHDHGNVEFAMLGGVTVLSEQDGDDDLTAVGIPYVVPGFRMAYWTGSRLTVDGGLSVLSLSVEDDEVTATNLEGGIGVRLGAPDKSLVPFVGGLVGIISLSNGDSESGFYLGGQGGIKVFFTDYSAFRMQLSYRTMLDDELDYDALEIAAGLSFFL